MKNEKKIFKLKLSSIIILFYLLIFKCNIIMIENEGRQ